MGMGMDMVTVIYLNPENGHVYGPGQGHGRVHGHGHGGEPRAGHRI